MSGLRDLLRRIFGRANETDTPSPPEPPVPPTPRDAPAWTTEGQRLAKLGQWEGASACYERALALDPQNAHAFNGKGLCLAAQGRLEEAIAAYAQAVAIDPQLEAAWFGKALAEEQIGLTQDAIQSFEGCVSAAPAQDAAQIEYARQPLRKLGGGGEYTTDPPGSPEPGPSVSMHRHPPQTSSVGVGADLKGDRGLEEPSASRDQPPTRDQDVAATLYNKGLNMAALGRLEDAVACYEQALALDSELAAAWFGKALAEERIGREHEAVRSYERYIALGPAQDRMQIEHARRRVDQLGFDTEDKTVTSAPPDPDPPVTARHSAPQDAVAWYNDGTKLLAQKRLEGAITCYSRALELDPDYADAWLIKGGCLSFLGRQEEALICFERALALDPHDARSLEHLGRCLGALGRHQEAIVSLDRALALDPYSVEVWSLKGSSLGELGRHVEAIACFDQSLARDPRHTMSLNNKGNSLAALGRLQEAALCFDQAVALTPKEAVVWHAKGAHLTALEDWDEALACCDRALELDPRYAAAWVNKGTCFCGLERWYEAISCFDRALELDPQLAAAWHNKGACLTAMHRRDEAISCLNQALELDPQIVQAWRKKGNNLIALNQWDEAIDCFERALELDPKEAAAWANKGFCLASSSRHEEAIACFDRAAALNPAKAKVFGFGKGASLAQLERWEEAITCYEYALALDPHMAEAWYNKARAEEKAGLPLDAARAYDRCVTAAPGTAAHIHHAYHRLGELLLGMENQAGSPALCEPGLSVPPIKSEQHRAAATRREYQKGDRIGQNYEVLDVLGHGGFGVVYLVRERRFLDARDLKTLFGDNPPPPHPSSLVYTDATYALKTFLSRYLTDSKVRDRFRREAQVLVDLEGHPYLLKAESVDEIAGRLYLVTEYVAPNAEGLNSLEGYLQRQPPDLAQSLQWAIQCCYGMEHAFSKGLRCHRDLKPANILITQDGVVKIADFGLAAALDQTRLADGVEVHMINGRPVSRWRSLLVYGKLCFHEPSQGHRRAANLRKGHPLAVNGDTIYRQAQYRLLARKTCLLRVPVEKEHRWKRARKPD